MNRLIIENLEDDDNPFCQFNELGNLLAPRFNPLGFRVGIIGGTGSGKTNFLCNCFKTFWAYDRAVLLTSKAKEQKFVNLMEHVGSHRLLILQCKDDNNDWMDIESIVKEARDFLDGCAQGIIWFDDFTWELLNESYISHFFREGRKDNTSTGFSTQSFDRALSARGSVGKKKIVNNLTDLVLFDMPSKSQVTSICMDIDCGGIDTKQFTKLAKLFTRDQFDFLHYDRRADQTGSPEINDCDFEMKMTGIPFNSAVLRWNGDNSKWTPKICRDFKRQNIKQRIVNVN